MKEEQLSVSNSAKLAEFENNTMPLPFASVDGIDVNTMESVANFSLKTKDWLETIDKDILNLPHIDNSISLPEAVCGNDDRTLVRSTDAPFRYICSLVITAADNSRWIGSGFFISPRCVITNGHCLFIKSRGGWVKSITVIPGRNGQSAPYGSQASTTFRSIKGWTEQNNSDFDQGAIILPDNTLFNRIGGYFGYKELTTSIILNNSGYPGDKPSGTQWFNAGPATKVTDYKIEYMIDTAGGQSGSPVYISASGRYVIGVHGYGGCPNSCIRVRDYFFQRWSEWSRL